VKLALTAAWTVGYDRGSCL